MQILVTDAAGAVGRLVTRALTAAGHTVSGIAGRSLGDPALQHLADEAEVVIHLAPVEVSAPGGTGVDGVVRVAHAAARAGARLLFVSQAAGAPELYRQAETLVSTGWAPSLIVRMAPPMGRQLDWMVCRTVATLLRGKASPQPVRLLHLDDLVRFLVVATTTDRTGVVDLATPDATNTIAAWRLLRSVDPRSRLHGVHSWTRLTPELDIAAMQEDWMFECGWSATEAVADAARGLAGRRLAAAGAIDQPGHLPLPLPAPARLTPSDGLRCATRDGLEGEFDDRVDPRFPVFSATGLAATLPGPLSPMTLDVQLAGLRVASRVVGRVLALGNVFAGEWGNRAIAVFGHRAYLGVSANVVAASQLPGWEADVIAARALGGKAALANLFPAGRPSLSGRPLGSAAKSVVRARLWAMSRHLKTDTQAYSAAARAEHVGAAKLTTLADAALEVRIRLLRDRVYQGWCLTALWMVNTGVAGGSNVASGIGGLLESDRVRAEVAALGVTLRGDLRLLAAGGDLNGIRVRSPGVAADIDAGLARMAHRGPGEVELANPTFGDDPAILLAAAAAAGAYRAPVPDAGTPARRRATNARVYRELARDVTMKFTHELRMTLREFGSRRLAAELLDSPDDVYYLTCDELLAMPADARLRVKRRRVERERLQGLRPPDVIGLRLRDPRPKSPRPGPR